MDNPLSTLLAWASGGQAAQALADRGPASADLATAIGPGVAVKRRGTLEWVPLKSGEPVGVDDLVKFPQGGQFNIPGRGPMEVGPDSLMTWTEEGPAPVPRRGPVVSGVADFRPRR